MWRTGSNLTLLRVGRRHVETCLDNCILRGHIFQRKIGFRAKHVQVFGDQKDAGDSCISGHCGRGLHTTQSLLSQRVHKVVGMLLV